MTKKTVFLCAIIGLTALFLAAPWRDIAESGTGKAYASGRAVRALGPRFPAERVWILTIPTPLGNITMVHTMIAQDATGKRFTSWVQSINKNPTYFGMFPEAAFESDLFGQTIRTGQNSYETTLIVYATKNGPGPLQETARIGVGTVEWQVTDQDNLNGVATLAMYLGEQDKDGDGLPDEDEEPVNCMQFPYTGKRLKMMPPCEPTM
jgi:hypothetical protein